MPVVYNGTNEVVTIKAHGNFFKFNPDQKKLMSDNLASFIAENRRDDGLLVLPGEFEDPDYSATEDAKERLKKFKQECIDNLVSHHRRVIYNNQISLAQDLAKHNDKSDPAIFATEKSPITGWSTMDSMELVARYQSSKKDTEQKQKDRVKELMKDIGPITNK